MRSEKMKPKFLVEFMNGAKSATVQVDHHTLYSVICKNNGVQEKIVQFLTQKEAEDYGLHFTEQLNPFLLNENVK